MVISLTVSLLLFHSSQVFASTQTKNKAIQAEGALYVHGKAYAPVSELAKQMHWDLTWNAANQEVTIRNQIGDTLSYILHDNRFVYNHGTYQIKEKNRVQNNHSYFPLRLLASCMNDSVVWNKSTNTVLIEPVSTYTVEKGDTVETIAKKEDTTALLLEKRNGLHSENIKEGQTIKTVIPVPLKEKEEQIVTLLSKLVEAEATDEPYKEKLAVADVIMNRVQSDEFPDTLTDVIYEKGQFGPVTTGRIDHMHPKSSSIQAAKEALIGNNIVPDALYFYNPQKSKNSFLEKLKVVAKVGKQIFKK